MAFTHLNVHSCYSLLAGCMRPEEIPPLARRLGFTALALTDTDGLYAAVPFQRACEKEGLRAILGAEITRPRLRQESQGLFDDGDKVPTEPANSGTGSREAVRREPGGFARERPAGPGDPRHRATLLVRNEAGYRQLGEILTARHLDDDFSFERSLAAALGSGDLYVICSGESLLRDLVARRVAADPTADLSPRGDSCHVTQTDAPELSPRGDSCHVTQTDAPELSPRVDSCHMTQTAAPRLFVELRAAAGPGHLMRLQSLLRLAAELGLPAVTTGGVFFARPEDYELHRLLSAMRMNTSIDRLSARAAAPPSAWLMDEAEIRRHMGMPNPELFAPQGGGRSPDTRGAALDPRLQDAMRWSERIAADCDMKIPTGKPRPPRFSLPPCPDGRPQHPDAFLYRLAHEGLRERLGLAPGDRDRQSRRALAALRRELHVIRRRHVSAYFLIAWDLVRFGRSRGLASLGRGSAAGSLVSFALGITHVNPLEHQLYFERFLNLERQGLPDFDIDFGSEARYTVLDYAFAQYGRDRVAMIGTYQTFRPRGACRHIVGALGLDESEWDDFLRLMPRWGDCREIRKTLSEDPKTRHLDLNRGEIPRILDLAGRIGGLPRHLGTHPCGIVIAPGPIAHFVPLQRGGRGLAITQWDMHAVEDAGLVKMDILGQRGLAVIDATAARVLSNFGQAPRLAGEPPPRLSPRSARGVVSVGEAAGATNPFLDPPTRALLAAGRSEGCFYIESPIMMQIMRQARCDDFETLTALSSIIRPGVSSHGGKRQYLLRHRGEQAVSLPHPLLEGVLRDTYGCLIYQEQVMRVLQVLGGLTLGEADRFRKIMSGKSSGGEEKIDPKALSAQFMEGAMERLTEAGEEEESALAIAGEVCRQVVSFASYAFCKAHSASFARESFESAYWKANYPAEFMASVIEERGGYYATAEYVEEARRLGLEILPPHVNAGTVQTLGFGKGSKADDPAGDGGRLPARGAADFAASTRGDASVAGVVASTRGDASAVAHAAKGTASGAANRYGKTEKCTRVHSAPPGPTQGSAGASCHVTRTAAAKPSTRVDSCHVTQAVADETTVGRGHCGRLRIGLSFMGGVRQAALDWVADEGSRRPFVCLRELVERVRDDGAEAPRRYELARLIRVGALDGLPIDSAGAEPAPRSTMLGKLGHIWPESSGARANEEAFAPLPRLSRNDPNALLRARAALEVGYLGFSPSVHPLLLCPGYAAARARSITADQLDAMASTVADREQVEMETVSLIGIKVSSKRTRTEKDARIMCFTTFSDETGNFEAVFYPNDYERVARALRGPGPFRITGPAEADLGQALVAGKRVERLG